jgi:DNA-binding CsgD family transcriptional regulator
MGASDRSAAGNAASARAARIPPPQFPPWVQSIRAAVWVTSPDRRISYINDLGCALLGVKPRAALGRPCHEVVCGHLGGGCNYCDQHCPAISAALKGGAIEPVRLQVGAPPHGHWVRLVVIAAGASNGDFNLVHCALDDDRAERVEAYLGRVVLRTRPADLHRSQLLDAGLTRREFEVLRLLAEDETLQGIALRLRISYATVRNHVQHLLGKLGLHSIMEAVALYLLTADEPPDDSSHKS